MLKLALPPKCGLDCYDDLVNRRRDKNARTLFTDNKLVAALRKAYVAYDAKTPDFDDSFAKASMSVAHAALVKELYDRYKHHLRDAVRSAQPRTSATRVECQLCGIGTVGSLDHYLGKAEYGEFYVFPPNLVPSCTTCNSPRATFDSAGKRRIVHLLADDVSNLPSMIVCTVSVTNGEPEARYELQTGLKGTLAALFRRHWKALNLKERYEQLAPSALETIREQNLPTVRREAMTAAGLANTFADDAAGIEKVHGKNHPHAALHRGAAQSKTFLAYCEAR